jgi:beta-glucan synthesis-associated protein KRE6
MKYLIFLSYKLYFIIISLIFISHVQSNWIDPDTRPEDRSITSYATEKTYSLIFSDEFNVNNRRFDDGHDPRWTAIHKNDYTNYALHYYSKDLVHTNDGYLNITTKIQDISFEVQRIKNGKIGKGLETKNYQSAMIQGWNKFCFTSGIIELRAKLPGDAYIGGFWPAIWLLGNLARATYVSSSNNVWPWSYDQCNKKFQSQQLFSKCNAVNHFHLNSYQGRGAPEIDIFEVMPGQEVLVNTNTLRPYMSTSLQVAPAIVDYRPVTAFEPDYSQWYNHGVEYGLNSSLNIFFYGMYLKGVYEERSYLADAISSNTNMEPTHFNDFHNYRIEWKAGDDGYIRWYLDDIFRYGIHADALNMTGAQIPAEPM